MPRAVFLPGKCRRGTKCGFYFTFFTRIITTKCRRLNHEIRCLASVLWTLHLDGVYDIGRMPKLGHALPKDELFERLRRGGCRCFLFFRIFERIALSNDRQ